MPVRVLLCGDTGPIGVLLPELLRDAPSVDLVGHTGDARDCAALALWLEPEVVLLDLPMPVLDGLKALKILRYHCPEIPLVAMLSSYDARHFRQRAGELGAAGHLEKGAPLQEIVDAIHTAAARRTDRLQRFSRATPVRHAP